MSTPDLLTDEHLEYLDNLRDSGVTNMYGAGAYLEVDFPELGRREAREIVGYWMQTFSDRHPPKEKRCTS